MIVSKSLKSLYDYGHEKAFPIYRIYFSNFLHFLPYQRLKRVREASAQISIYG